LSFICMNFIILRFTFSFNACCDSGWRLLYVVSLGQCFMKQQELCRR